MNFGEAGRVRPVDVNYAKKDHPKQGIRCMTVRQLVAARCDSSLYAPQRVQFYVAILVTDGRCNHCVDFAPVPLSPGDLLLVRPGQVHFFDRRSSIEGQIFTFTPEFLTTLSDIPSILKPVEQLFASAPKIHLSGSSTASLRDWFDDLSRELACRGGRNGDDRIAFAFGLLLHRMLTLNELQDDRVSLDKRDDTLTQSFTALLEAHFLTRRSAGWYAKALRVSSRTLDRRLALTLHYTCKELLSNRLLLEAKRLLIEPGWQIKEVAYELGFTEIANFTRFFRQRTGMPPSKFRLRVSKGR